MIDADAGVERLVLLPAGGPHRRQNLAGDAQVRESDEGDVLLQREAPHRLQQADHTLLKNVLPLTAAEEIGARLGVDKAGVLGHQQILCPAVAAGGGQSQRLVGGDGGGFFLRLHTDAPSCGKCRTVSD